MNIRKAEESDINGIMELLRQIRNVHADIRPDIFSRDEAKYTAEELARKMKSMINPIYVAVNEDGKVLGHVFCEQRFDEWSDVDNPRYTFFIDDFCVDETIRGQHVGGLLFEFVKTEAKRRNCHNITLNVWLENNEAVMFYLGMGMKQREATMEYVL